jgi:hypothetical protein
MEVSCQVWTRRAEPPSSISQARHRQLHAHQPFCQITPAKEYGRNQVIELSCAGATGFDSGHKKKLWGESQ